MPFFLAALPWLKKFGPWIAVGLVALGVWAAANTLVRDWKKSIHDTAFAAGVKKESDRQDAIARRIEQVLGPRLDSIDTKTGAQLVQQAKKETIYVDRIRTKIKTDPRYSACAVDDSLLRDRNEIRASLGSTIDTKSGSGTGGTPTTPSADH